MTLHFFYRHEGLSLPIVLSFIRFYLFLSLSLSSYFNNMSFFSLLISLFPTLFCKFSLSVFAFCHINHFSSFYLLNVNVLKVTPSCLCHAKSILSKCCLLIVSLFVIIFQNIFYLFILDFNMNYHYYVPLYSDQYNHSGYYTHNILIIVLSLLIQVSVISCNLHRILTDANKR